MAEKRVKSPAQKKRELIAYLICLGIGVLQFGVPRIWMTAKEFKAEIGDYAGYVCILWLGFILLMPTFARFFRGRWVKLMSVRKQFGIGVGFFIIAHGFFSHMIECDGELSNLNPRGSGAGFINFFFAVLLLITSINRVRLSMSRKWWEFHQRLGTFAMFWVGSTAAFGSKHALLPLLSTPFCLIVLEIRLVQLYIGRSKINREKFFLNAWGLFIFFTYMVLNKITGRFYSLTIALAALCMVLYLVHLIRRPKNSGERPKSKGWDELEESAPEQSSAPAKQAARA